MFFNKCKLHSYLLNQNYNLYTLYLKKMYQYNIVYSETSFNDTSKYQTFLGIKLQHFYKLNPLNSGKLQSVEKIAMTKSIWYLEVTLYIYTYIFFLLILNKFGFDN